MRRRAPKRVAVTKVDRLVFAALYHLAPAVLDAVKTHGPGFNGLWITCENKRPEGAR
jgi:hypothetical protein